MSNSLLYDAYGKRRHIRDAPQWYALQNEVYDPLKKWGLYGVTDWVRGMPSNSDEIRKFRISVS